MPTSLLRAGRASPARLWHAVTALTLAAAVVFFTRGPTTDAGAIRFECGGLQVQVAPEDDAALLTAGTQVFELHRTRTASGARYDAPEDPSGTYFWDKGEMATVVVQGDTYPACRRLS